MNCQSTRPCRSKISTRFLLIGPELSKSCVCAKFVPVFFLRVMKACSFHMDEKKDLKKREHPDDDDQI